MLGSLRDHRREIGHGLVWPALDSGTRLVSLGLLWRMDGPRLDGDAYKNRLNDKTLLWMIVGTNHSRWAWASVCLLPPSLQSIFAAQPHSAIMVDLSPAGHYIDARWGQFASHFQAQIWSWKKSKAKLDTPSRRQKCLEGGEAELNTSDAIRFQWVIGRKTFRRFRKEIIILSFPWWAKRVASESRSSTWFDLQDSLARDLQVRSKCSRLSIKLDWAS